MKNLSRFDLGMIIAFVVVALLGGGAWYYLSTRLSSAQADAAAASGDFDTYTKKQVYLPSGGNVTTLQADIDTITARLDPLVKNVLQSPKSELSSATSIDTVQWKHMLDAEVQALNDAAKTHGVIVPDHFYYGFSRYLNANPPEEATAVLRRQEIGVEQIARILVDSSVKSIGNIRRTYEEDAAAASGDFRGNKPDADQLAGRSQEAPDGIYTSYPFEIDFDAKTEAFRKVVNDLMHSPYVFVIRSVLVQNSRQDSPKITDLDTLAGVGGPGAPPPPSVTASSPGAVAAASASTVGVQYLFGDETLHIRMRVDLIDWHGIAADTTPAAKTTRGK